MKVEYKNIRGILGKDSNTCCDCCFYDLPRCIPYNIYPCRGRIFESGITQIFNL